MQQVRHIAGTYSAAVMLAVGIAVMLLLFRVLLLLSTAMNIDTESFCSKGSPCVSFAYNGKMSRSQRVETLIEEVSNENDRNKSGAARGTRHANYNGNLKATRILIQDN